MKKTPIKHTSLFSLIRTPAIHLMFSTACLCLTACASIVSKSQYPVTITSNPSGVKFDLKKENGTLISTGVTPQTVSLDSSNGYFKPAKYVIDFTGNGATRTVPLNASINGWYFGNILLGGAGIVIGMLVLDPATGAMWRLDKNVATTLS